MLVSVARFLAVSTPNPTKYADWATVSWKAPRTVKKALQLLWPKLREKISHYKARSPAVVGLPSTILGSVGIPQVAPSRKWYHLPSSRLTLEDAKNRRRGEPSWPTAGQRVHLSFPLEAVDSVVRSLNAVLICS